MQMKEILKLNNENHSCRFTNGIIIIIRVGKKKFYIPAFVKEFQFRNSAVEFM